MKLHPTCRRISPRRSKCVIKLSVPNNVSHTCVLPCTNIDCFHFYLLHLSFFAEVLLQSQLQHIFYIYRTSIHSNNPPIHKGVSNYGDGRQFGWQFVITQFCAFCLYQIIPIVGYTLGVWDLSIGQIAIFSEEYLTRTQAKHTNWILTLRNATQIWQELMIYRDNSRSQYNVVSQWLSPYPECSLDLWECMRLILVTEWLSLYSKTYLISIASKSRLISPVSTCNLHANIHVEI